MRVLCLETSTSSAKALVYDEALGVIAAETERFGAGVATPGQQDARKVHAALMRVGKKVASGHPIDAIGLSSSWHSICVCDRTLTPVTPVYTWEYDEGAPLSAQMRADKALTERLYRATGCMPNITYPRQTLLYLLSQGLSLKDHCLMTQGGYSFHQLTGVYAESVNIQSGGGFIQLAQLRYDPFVLDMLGLRANQLGDLATYQDTAPLSAQAAMALGVTPGIPVVPAHSDGACNQVGSGCAAPGNMTLSVGTSGAMRMTTTQPMLSANQETWCYVGADGYIAGAAVAGAGNCVTWFQKGLLNEHFNFDALELEGDILSQEVPPIFLPFLFGERCPGWQDKRLAGFVEVSGRHGTQDLFYALRMGILFNMLQCYGPLTDMVGMPEQILVSGGILNSRQWCQMLADILNHPVRLVPNHDASLIGAAVLALHAAGACPDIRSFEREAREAVEVAPVASHVPWYQAQYARYLNWYEKTATD